MSVFEKQRFRSVEGAASGGSTVEEGRNRSTEFVGALLASGSLVSGEFRSF